MKMKRILLSVLLFALALVIISFNNKVYSIAYASEENYDLEEEKWDKADEIEEREAQGDNTDEQENEYNDIQDEQDNVNGR